MYDNNLNVYSYVCSHCFHPLYKSECDQYPENLIQIDKQMVPGIRELNKRFYKTEGCCEGYVGKFDNGKIPLTMLVENNRLFKNNKN